MANPRAFDLLKRVAAEVKRRWELPVRVNTNGQGSLICGRNIAPEFEGIVDTVSISLNTPNADEYAAIVRSRFGDAAFPGHARSPAKCAKIRAQRRDDHRGKPPSATRTKRLPAHLRRAGRALSHPRLGELVAHATATPPYRRPSPQTPVAFCRIPRNRAPRGRRCRAAFYHLFTFSLQTKALDGSFFMHNRTTSRASVIAGGICVALFALLTVALLAVDRQPIAGDSSLVGLAAFNLNARALLTASMTWPKSCRTSCLSFPPSARWRSPSWIASSFHTASAPLVSRPRPVVAAGLLRRHVVCCMSCSIAYRPNNRPILEDGVSRRSPRRTRFWPSPCWGLPWCKSCSACARRRLAFGSAYRLPGIAMAGIVIARPWPACTGQPASSAASC